MTTLSEQRAVMDVLLDVTARATHPPEFTASWVARAAGISVDAAREVLVALSREEEHPDPWLEPFAVFRCPEHDVAVHVAALRKPPIEGLEYVFCPSAGEYVSLDPQYATVVFRPTAHLVEEGKKKALDPNLPMTEAHRRVPATTR